MLVRRPRQEPAGPRRLGARVLTAQLINDLGSGVTSIALPLLVFARTGSVAATSLVYIVNAVPAIFFSFIGGAHADRANRKHLVTTFSASAGVLLCLLPVLYRAAGLAAVLVLAFGVRTLTSFSSPAFRASLPALFGDDFQDYSGKRAGLSFLAQAAGPVLGGALVGLTGAANAVYADGASYLVFAAIIAGIRDFDPDAATRQAKARAASTLRAIREGLAHLRSNSGAAALLAYWFLSLSAVPISLLAAIPYLRHTLHESSLKYGLAVTAYAVASIAGSYLAGKYHFTGGARRWLLLSGLGYGTASLLMITRPGYYWFLALWFLWGIAYGPEEVVGQVAFAQLVPEEFRGRMYAVMSVVISCASLVGAAVAGPLTDSLGPTTTMFIAGLIFIAATLISFTAGPGARALRQVDLSRA
jgi:MFS family permease